MPTRRSDRHRDGFTPLHRACWGGEPRHTDTVRVLLEAGVSPFELSADGKRPIDMTRRRETRELLLGKMAQAEDEREL